MAAARRDCAWGSQEGGKLPKHKIMKQFSQTKDAVTAATNDHFTVNFPVTAGPQGTRMQNASAYGPLESRPKSRLYVPNP